METEWNEGQYQSETRHVNGTKNKYLDDPLLQSETRDTNADMPVDAKHASAFFLFTLYERSETIHRPFARDRQISLRSGLRTLWTVQLFEKRFVFVFCFCIFFWLGKGARRSMWF